MSLRRSLILMLLKFIYYSFCFFLYADMIGWHGKQVSFFCQERFFISLYDI